MAASKSAQAGVPVSVEAEASVVGSMLARPKITGEVVGTMLQPDHFFYAGHQMLFNQIVDAFYSDEPADPLSIVERCGQPLLRTWNCDAGGALERVRAMVAGAQPRDAVAHCKIVRQDWERRSLLDLVTRVEQQVAAREDPEAIAAQVTTEAAQLATQQLLTNEIISFGDLGRRMVERQRALMVARAQGIEIGVRFGMNFLDDRLHGLKGSEVLILAGAPGEGKSSISWVAATQFAERQMVKPPEQRIGTLVISAEMAEEPSSDRIAQNLARVDGAHLRDGDTSEDELARIIKEWGARRELPLYYNFTSMMRASQMRALVATAVQRYGVGLVVIDHMRYFDPDVRLLKASEEDEEKARFVRERIAKDLNVAVILLAHTVKIPNDRKPLLNDLRGGQMVSAHADFVVFTYRPYRHATHDEILDEKVDRTEMELLWEKNRHNDEDPTYAFFEPSTMTVRDPV